MTFLLHAIPGMGDNLRHHRDYHLDRDWPAARPEATDLIRQPSQDKDRGTARGQTRRTS